MMSSSSESVETGLRVTRSKLRMNSTDSTLSNDQRPQTPTGRTRNAKKLEVIEEKLNTPTRRTTRASSIQRENETPTTTPTKRNTRAGSIQRVIVEENQLTATAALTPTKRITRAGSVQRLDEIKGSPARSTRRLSSDKNPLQESSIILIDDDSISENALTPRTLKRNPRISIITKLEEVKEEELEVNNPIQNVDLNKSDSSNELELRNRSISKSPSVAQHSSLNSSTSDFIESAKIQPNDQNVEIISDIIHDENQTGSSTEGLKKFLTSHVSFSETDASGDEVIKRLSQNEIVNEPEETEKSFKSVSLKVNSSSVNQDISINTYSEQSNDETLSMSVFCSRKSNVDVQPMEIDGELINLQTPPISHDAKSPQKNLMSSIEKEKIKSLEQMIVEEKNKCESTEQIDSEKLVSTMMEDFIVETPTKSPKHKSFNKSKIEDNDNSTVKSPLLNKSLNKNTIEDKQEPDIIENSEISTEKSPIEQTSLNKNNVDTDDVNLNISTAKYPKQRKSLNNSKVIEEDQSSDNSEISQTNGPNLQKSLNKSKIEDEEEETNSSVQNRSSIDSSEVSPKKSLKSHKSLNDKSKIEEASNTDISSTKLPKQRKSLNDIRTEKKDFSAAKNNSWSQSIRKSASEHIDNLKTVEKEIIKDTSKRSKIISSDESENEDYENDSFIDDEAEVASDEDSMTPSERNYLEENEIVDLGETLGSEDSESDEDYHGEEEEDEDDDSFIDNDENISDKYSMDSEEELIEKDIKKRKSRIIYPLSSSEDENESKKKIFETTLPEKIKETNCMDVEDKEKANADILSKRKSIDQSIQTEETSMNQQKSSDNMKENIENIINSLETPVLTDKKQKKRKRDSDFEKSTITPKRVKFMTANESEAVHMEDNSHLIDNENNQETNDEQKSVHTTSKKTKREIDYNAIFERVNQHMEEFKANKKAQAELKKEKKAKKLAKKKNLEQNSNGVVDSLSGDDKENSLKKKKKNKTKKQKHVEEIDDGKKEDLGSRLDKLQEKLELKRQRKREKKLAKIQENETATVSKETKKSKKEEKTVEMIEEDIPSLPKKSKIKIRKNETDKPLADTYSNEKIKNKRKIEDADESLSEMIEVPRVNKKLKVLKQIDEPIHRIRQKTIRTEEPKQVDAVINLKKKLKNIIPNELSTATNKTKKHKLTKKVIAESKVSLPRPIFTTAGIFMEESITPYKFKSKEYMPIKSKMGREPIALFQAAKKKSVVAPYTDFRSEKLKKKNRDKSVKNLKNLM